METGTNGKLTSSLFFKFQYVLREGSKGPRFESELSEGWGLLFMIVKVLTFALDTFSDDLKLAGRKESFSGLKDPVQ